MKESLSIVGTTVSHYRMLSRLGAGGMGEVYLAEDTELDRKVAIKLLPVESALDESAKKRLIREARAAAKLDHPNICAIHEVGEDQGRSFIVMQYVEGETLGKVIQRKPLDLCESLDIAVQIVGALVEAHSRGIVHRDIKPQNLMIAARGQVKVLDFGLAKIVQQKSLADSAAETESLLTEPGMIIGTVPYMSPEQVRGETLDDRTDIFSFGAVVYEMVSGRQPFAAENAAATISTVLTKEPPPLARYSREVPDELERIVSKALRKDREQRYQTAKDLLIDLKSLSDHLEFEAKLERSRSPDLKSGTAVVTNSELAMVETAGQPAVQTGAVGVGTTSSAGYLVSNAVRNKKGLALVALSLVIVIAGIVYVAGRGKAIDSIAVLPFVNLAEPFQKMKVTRLTTTGKATVAAISPDGKYVAHAMGGRSQQSLWLRHIATGSDKEIVPTDEVDYTALTFSPDGNYICFLRLESVEGLNPLYRVPVLGGSIQKLGSDIDAGITFSPDGRQIAYIRGYPARNEAQLLTAKADGTEERALLNIQGQKDVFPGFKYRAWGPAWSPDGGVIAFALRKDEPDGQYWNVMTVGIKDHAEQQITFQKWSSLGQLAWLSDGRGLIVGAAENEGYPAQQVWHVSYPAGEVRKITNDTNDYNGIRLTGNSTALVTVRTEQSSNVWIAPDGDASRAAQVTTNNFEGVGGVSWTPDGRIAYTTRALGSSNISIVSADGTSQQQLTIDAADNFSPSVSPDGRYVVFASTRTGSGCIWRMDIDGSNPKQLTYDIDAKSPCISPDGKWVVYRDARSGKGKLWKVSIAGSDPVQVTDYYSVSPSVSPDGKQIVSVFLDEQAKRWRIAIIPFDGGPPAKVFDLPQPSGGQTVRWTSDGRALTYLNTRNGVSNIWAQPLDGSQPKQLTNFMSDQIFAYAWSRDGKRLACARGNQISDVVLINAIR